MSDDHDEKLIEREEDLLLQSQDELDRLESEILWGDDELSMEAVMRVAAIEAGVTPPDKEEYDRAALAREGRYIQALRAVLETREGQIVIRHFLDQTDSSKPLYEKSADIYRRAALYDYAQERMGEISLAGRKYCYEMFHQATRDSAFEYKLEKLLTKGR